MLDARGDTRRLHRPARYATASCGGEIRVLAVALEVAAAHREAVDVHGRTEQHVRALGAGPRRRVRRPRCPSSSASHDAPSAMPHGKHTDGGPPVPLAPRAPIGPSVILSRANRGTAGSPSGSTAGTCHMSSPASSHDLLLEGQQREQLVNVAHGDSAAAAHVTSSTIWPISDDEVHVRRVALNARPPGTRRCGRTA